MHVSKYTKRMRASSTRDKWDICSNITSTKLTLLPPNHIYCWTLEQIGNKQWYLILRLGPWVSISRAYWGNPPSSFPYPLLQSCNGWAATRWKSPIQWKLLLCSRVKASNHRGGRTRYPLSFFQVLQKPEIPAKWWYLNNNDLLQGVGKGIIH